MLLADGSAKAIKDVAVKDRVASRDPQHAVAGAHPVTALVRHGGPHEMVAVSLSNGATVTATENHPFWDVTTHSWTHASSLRPGDKLQTQSLGTVTVTSTRPFVRSLTAYNLTVDVTHTYYVLAGVTPVLVHNCGDPWMGENTYTKIERDHGPNSSVPGKSRFYEGVDYEDLADHSADFRPRGETTGTRCERICSSPNGRPIGVDQNGLPTNVYTVVTEENGRIVTMHPGRPN